MTIIEIGNVDNYGQIYRAVEFPRWLCSIIKSKKEKRLYKKNRIFPFFFSFFFFSSRVSRRRLRRNIREKWRRQLSTCEFRCRYKILYRKTRIYIYIGSAASSQRNYYYKCETAKRANLVIIIFTTIMIMDTAMLMYIYK